MHKLSVIVPIYNGAKYLNRCLDSILTQEFTDFELILVDDGSTDNSLKICNDYIKKDNRVIVLHKENGGLVSARKFGLSVAKGEYIGFVDCDDYIDRNMYMDLLEVAVRDDVDIVVGGIVLDYYNKSRKMLNAFSSGVYTGEGLKNYIIPRMLIYSGFVNYGIIPGVVIKAFKRELLLKSIQKVDNSVDIGEDVAITAYSVMLAESVGIIDSAAYHYVQGEESMVRKFNPNKIDKINNLYKCISRIENDNYLKQIDLYISFLIFNFIGECINKSGYDKKKLLETLKDILNHNLATTVLGRSDISDLSIENKLKVLLMRYRLVRVLIFFLRR